ncbi:MAG: insulinase family protein [Nitrospira sp.]|nr:insulinase family protein [Nitrospira sp.]
MNAHKLTKAVLLTLLINSLFLLFHSPVHALEVNRKVLDNGMVLMMVERHNLPIVKVTVGFNAGNLNEPEDKAGLASLTAGMLTEGTKTRAAQQISEEIEFVGGSVGASGGGDYATADLSILKKDLDLGFELLSDIILNPVFPDEEITKRKERVKGSLKSMEDDPGFLASREFKKAVFGTHPYGRLQTGTVETLDNIERQDLVDFHSAYYLPNNAVMSVVGDITYEEVEALIEKYFGEWHAGELKAADLPEISFVKERKTITLDKDLTQANVILGHIGVSRDDPDYYAISVMNYILGGGGFASRLMDNIRDEKGLVYSIHSYFAANKYGGSFQVGLQTKNESANIAVEEILKEIEKIRTEPVLDSELSDAKSFLTGSFPMRIDMSRKIASFLVAVEYHGLGADYIEKYPGYINSVTKKDILRVAKKYLDPENFTLVVVANQQEAALKEEW